MKPRFDVILEQALTEGIARGWERAHKHHEDPQESWIKDTMHDCIMESFYQYFIFEHIDHYV